METETFARAELVSVVAMHVVHHHYSRHRAAPDEHRSHGHDCDCGDLAAPTIQLSANRGRKDSNRYERAGRAQAEGQHGRSTR